MRDDDITSNYHGGHPRSQDANRRTNKRRDINRIYAHVHSLGRRGAICDECEEPLKMVHQTCSARFSEMKKAGLLMATGEQRLTRKNCWADVYVTKGIWQAHFDKEPPAPAPQFDMGL